ncbi:uncharacterized protein LOC111365701 [Olea europaea var. sylvestris]|uniref:uncharacterized protein LOC111365701 n=1 Tax=Olea europaea var. sylvestris TaxID=158386 RepID=UPI000C1D611F|nr:uncharacterized protein LOC111365701 [Olea europaea var. sylvestris]
MVPPMQGSNQPLPFGVNLTQMVSMKLDKNNFLLWKNMILPIIRGHNLEGHILGTKLCPLEFISTQTTGEAGASVKVTQNPQYSQWMFIDQLLIGWLYSSMTPEIAMRVMGSSNSNQLWTTVNESYVKLLADNLEVAGKTIPLADLITQVLVGLDEEYTPIVVQINSRDSIS